MTKGTETILLVLGGLAVLLVLMKAMTPKPAPPPPPPPQNALSGLGSIVGDVAGLAAFL
jgi:hypothetical protein